MLRKHTTRTTAEKWLQNWKKPFRLGNHKRGRIFFAQEVKANNQKVLSLKLETTVKIPHIKKFDSYFGTIKNPSFLNKNPKLVSNFLMKVFEYASARFFWKTDQEMTVPLQNYGQNAMTLLLAPKGDLALSERAVDRLVFWITRKKNSPMEFFSENKIFTKIEFGDSKIVGVVPSFFSAAELSAFIFACDRLPTVSEANQFYLKQQESIGKERV